MGMHSDPKHNRIMKLENNSLIINKFDYGDRGIYFFENNMNIS